MISPMGVLEVGYYYGSLLRLFVLELSLGFGFGLGLGFGIGSMGSTGAIGVVLLLVVLLLVVLLFGVVGSTGGAGGTGLFYIKKITLVSLSRSKVSRRNILHNSTNSTLPLSPFHYAKSRTYLKHHLH